MNRQPGTPPLTSIELKLFLIGVLARKKQFKGFLPNPLLGDWIISPTRKSRIETWMAFLVSGQTLFTCWGILFHHGHHYHWRLAILSKILACSGERSVSRHLTYSMWDWAPAPFRRSGVEGWFSVPELFGKGLDVVFLALGFPSFWASAMIIALPFAALEVLGWSLPLLIGAGGTWSVETSSGFLSNKICPSCYGKKARTDSTDPSPGERMGLRYLKR